VKILRETDVSGWMQRDGLIAGYRRAAEMRRSAAGGRTRTDADGWSEAGDLAFLDSLRNTLGAGRVLAAAIAQLAAERPDATDDALESLPFYSLCRGLFLPLSGLDRARIEQQFGFAWPAPPLTKEQRNALVADFLARPVGLTLYDKVCLVLGDPFGGRKGWVARDSLVESLAGTDLQASRELFEKLPRYGEVAWLAADLTPNRRGEPALTSVEVVYALRHMREMPMPARRALLREMLARCGKVERYFLCALILRKTHFKYQFGDDALANALAAQFNVPIEQVRTAGAILDIFETTRLLQDKGADGLRSVSVQPLQTGRADAGGRLAAGAGRRGAGRVDRRLVTGAVPVVGREEVRRDAVDVAQVDRPSRQRAGRRIHAQPPGLDGVGAGAEVAGGASAVPGLHRGW
jgi:hypothetical protein